MVKEDLNKESFRDAISVYHLSLQKIIKGNDQTKIIEADKAGRKEVNNIMDNKAMKAIKYKDMTPQQKGNIHRAFMFYKDKYDDGGNWESLKARLVVNGCTVSTTDLGDLYAGTVQPISVMTMLATAAMKGYDVAVDFLFDFLFQTWVKEYPVDWIWFRRSRQRFTGCKRFV